MIPQPLHVRRHRNFPSSTPERKSFYSVLHINCWKVTNKKGKKCIFEKILVELQRDLGTGYIFLI